LSTWEAFDRLSLPTLVLTGQYDTLVRAKIAHEASARNHWARGVMVKNASHFLHLEAPDVVLPVILGHTTRFD
jgi:pimeloyl-ACP methyl ester carboxylesterase